MAAKSFVNFNSEATASLIQGLGSGTNAVILLNDNITKAAQAFTGDDLITGTEAEPFKEQCRQVINASEMVKKLSSQLKVLCEGAAETLNIATNFQKKSVEEAVAQTTAAAAAIRASKDAK